MRVLCNSTLCFYIGCEILQTQVGSCFIDSVSFLQSRLCDILHIHQKLGIFFLNTVRRGMETSHAFYIFLAALDALSIAFPLGIVSFNITSSSICLPSFLDIHRTSPVFLIRLAFVLHFTWKRITWCSLYILIFLAYMPLQFLWNSVINKCGVYYRPIFRRYLPNYIQEWKIVE